MTTKQPEKNSRAQKKNGKKTSGHNWYNSSTTIKQKKTHQSNISQTKHSKQFDLETQIYHCMMPIRPSRLCTTNKTPKHYCSCR